MNLRLTWLVWGRAVLDVTMWDDVTARAARVLGTAEKRVFDKWFILFVCCSIAERLSKNG